MIDLGFDLGLFSDRLNVVFDWYWIDIKDILFEKNLFYVMGGYGFFFFKIWFNVGEICNIGVELSIISCNFVGFEF